MQVLGKLKTAVKLTTKLTEKKGHSGNGENGPYENQSSKIISILHFTTVLSHCDFPWDIQVAFPGECQLRESHATQPTVHAGCFSVSIIPRSLTWTTGSLTTAQMLKRPICTRGCTDTVRESARTDDFGRKIPRRPENRTFVSGMPVGRSTN